jgi:hypothetical protein
VPLPWQSPSPPVACRWIKTFDRTTTVEVTWAGWLHKGVEEAKDVWWVWVTLLAGGGGLFAWKRKLEEADET